MNSDPKKKNETTTANNAYSLWRVNGCQQDFRLVAKFVSGGQESSSKPPQAICKPLANIRKKRIEKSKIPKSNFIY